MSTGFFYGQIVRIRVARHGKEKLRPVVVATPNEAMAAEGRVRGGTGRGADPPHPPLRGTFSRREKGFCPSPAG